MNLPESMSIPIYGGYGNSSLASSTAPSLKFPAKLEIVRQPKKRGYRFRYMSEGKTHGMLPGEPNASDKDGGKVFPCIKLRGYHGKAKVVMTLVQNKHPYRMHPHTLLIDKIPVKGFHTIEITGEQYIELKNIAIQHVNKGSLTEKLMDRELQSDFVHEVAISSFLQYRHPSQPTVNMNYDSFTDSLQDRDQNVEFYNRKTKIALQNDEECNLREKAKDIQKTINMSACRLCFMTFIPDQSGKFCQLLEPLYSDEIIDGKKKEGAPLKIIRLSHVAGSVDGGKEVWLLSDKVDSDDMDVYFWEKDEKGRVVWEALGEFNKTDIYKQALIVFKTPPYRDLTIDQPKTVNLQLRRRKDKNCVSDVHNFSYKPKQYDRYGLREKRRKVLPDEFYNAAPPAKRAAAEIDANNYYNDARWCAAGPENPSLSGLINTNSLMNVNDGLAALSSFTTTSFGNSLHQFLSNSTPMGADDSDSDPKEET